MNGKLDGPGEVPSDPGENPTTSPADLSDDFVLPDELKIPNDLSELTDALAAPKVEVILTQVATAEALAAACALNKIDALAASTPVGAYAVVTAGTGSEVAAIMSKTVAGVPLLLLSSTGGSLSASRWLDGVKQADVPAALVLGAGAPEELEALLIGSLSTAELTGAVASSSISRWKALRLLASQAKGRKGSQQ